MICRSAAFLSLGVLVAGTALMAQQRRIAPDLGQAAAQNGWLPSLEKGLAKARTTGKPVMVVLRCVP